MQKPETAFVEEGSYWVPAELSQRVVAIPTDLARYVEHVGYYPVTLKSIEGVRNDVGHFTLDWDSRVDIKCNLSEVQVRSWPADEFHAPLQLEEISEMNHASMLSAVSMRFGQGKFLTKIGGGSNSVYLWANPVRSEIVFKGGGTFRGGGNGGVDGAAALEAMRRIALTSAAGDDDSQAYVYPAIEKVRQVLLSEGSSQTIIFRGVSGSGKSEAMKSAIQYLLFAEHYASGTNAQQKVTELKNNVKQAASRVAADVEPAENYQFLGTLRHPFLVDTVVEGVGATSVAGQVGAKTLAGLMMFDYFFSCPSGNADRSSRCIKTVKFVYNTNSASVETSSDGALQSVEMSALLIDPHRISTGAKKGSGDVFLIFPMMMAGLTNAELTSLGITATIRSAYIAGVAGKKTEAELASDFRVFREQLLRAGCDEARFLEAMQSLACICHLQSVSIIGSDSAALSSSSIVCMTAVDKLMGLPKGLLSDYLLKNDTGRLGIIEHKPADSRIMLDSLCTAVYYRVVHWLSEVTCYKSMVSAHSSHSIPAAMPLPAGSYHMDFLDIMGWENIDVGLPGNLYTLSKNYCNERFQYQFLQLAFDRVVQDYLNDGVTLPNYSSPISPEIDIYTDLFDKLGTGIVSILEDVTKSMRPEDKAVLDKLLTTHSKTKMVRMAGQKATKKTDFMVQHSFNTCAYDLDGFSANNAAPAAYSRKSKAITEFLNKNTALLTLREEGSNAEDDTEEATPTPVSTRGGRPGGDSKGLQVRDFLLTRTKDVLTRFITQVSGSSGSPRGEGVRAARVHYILCFLTNPDASSFKLDGVSMIHQYKHLMLSALGNLHKNLLFGYSFGFSEFYRKYRLCFLFERKSLPTLPIILNANGEVAKAENLCKILLDECLNQAVGLGLAGTQAEVDATFGKGYKDTITATSDNSKCPAAAMFGQTRMYFRASLATLLDTILTTKQKMFYNSALKIQTHVRMKRDQRLFKKMRTGSILLSSFVRKQQGRSAFVKLKRCANRMRANVLMRKQRQIYLKMKCASNFIKERLMGSGFFFIRIRYLQMKREIAALHFAVRGRIMRKNTDRVLHFIRILQRAAMRFIFKYRWFRKKDAAALLICRMSRGMVTRRQFSTLVATITAMKKQRIANRVTTFLQLRFRGRKTQRRFHELRRAAMILQGVIRTRRARRRFIKGRKLVLWLQSKARQLSAINRVSFLYAAEMLLQERAKLSVIRDSEVASIRAQLHANANGAPYESDRVGVGSGLLKDGITPYKSYCLAINVGSSAISTIFPGGLLCTLNTFDDLLTQHGKCIATTSAVKKMANHLQSATSPIKGVTDFIKTTSALAATVSTKINKGAFHKEFHARKMVAGSHHLFILDDENNIYGVGVGHGGELGNACNKSHAAPILMEHLLDKLRKDQHSNLSAHDPLHPGNGSSTTTLKKSVQGGLTSVTRSSSDISSKNNLLTMTARINTNVIVREMCCGHEHTLLLSDGGLLWTWGNNWRGQLGHSDFASCNKPMLVKFKNRDSSKVHLKNKVLGMFGGEAETTGNAFNQSSTHSNATTTIHANNRTRFISCGSYHSACVSQEGYLYTWGASECLGIESEPLSEGQKARGKGSNDRSVPSLVMFFASNKALGGQKLVVSNLCCGEQHVHCFATPTLRNNTLSSGQAPLYAWGSNKSGQLGIGESKDKLIYRPVRVAGVPAVDLEELRHSHGADLLRAESSDLVTSKGPVIVANKAANYPDGVQLRSSGRHVLLMIAGKLWAWGWNSRGQVGNNTNVDCWVPTEIKLPLVTAGRTRGDYNSKIKSIAVGWHHSSAVCDDGAVFLWGAAGVLDPSKTETPTGFGSGGDKNSMPDLLVPTRMPDFTHNSPELRGEMAAEVESVSCSNFSLVTVKVVQAPDSAIKSDSTGMSTPTKDRSRSITSNPYTKSPPRSPVPARSLALTAKGSVHLGGKVAECVLSGNKGGFSPPRTSSVHDNARDEELINQTSASYGKSPLHGKRAVNIPYEQLAKSRFHSHEHAREHSKYCNDNKWAVRDATPLVTYYNQEPIGGYNIAKMSNRASNWEVHEQFRKHLSPRIKNPAYIRPQSPVSRRETGETEHKLDDPEIDALSLADTGYDSSGTSNPASPFDWGEVRQSSPSTAFIAGKKISPSGKKADKTGRRRSLNSDPKSATSLKRALRVEGILDFLEPARKVAEEASKSVAERIALKDEERASALAMFGEISDEDESAGLDGAPAERGDVLSDLFPRPNSNSKPLLGRGSVAGHGVRAPSMGGRRSSLSDNYSAFATHTLPLDKPLQETQEDQYLKSLQAEMQQGSYFQYSSPTDREGYESYEARARTSPSPARSSPNKLHISSVRDLQLQIQNMKMES